MTSSNDRGKRGPGASGGGRCRTTGGGVGRMGGRCGRGRKAGAGQRRCAAPDHAAAPRLRQSSLLTRLGRQFGGDSGPLQVLAQVFESIGGGRKPSQPRLPDERPDVLRLEEK